ncbi:MAG: PilN domain-containing protein [Phycisphaerae bacterium]|nr:PilN domain-containing protein [Phycisphaerae bacterium]
MSAMNLLPESYIKRQFRERLDLMCILIFAVIMGGAIIVDRMTRSSFDDAREKYTNASVTSKSASGLTGEFMALKRTKNEMMAQAQDAMKMEERIPRSYLLGVITNSLPEAISLTKIQLETTIPEPEKKEKETGSNVLHRKSSSEQPDADEPPAPKPDPIVTVTIEGVSVSKNDYEVAELIRTLKSKGLFKTIEPLYARQQESKKSDKSAVGGAELREFGIKMELLNEVDIRALIKANGGSLDAPITKPDKTENMTSGLQVEGASK